MQGSEVEIGGFKGRTNKLVDGCYSWWVGGSFGLLEAVGVGGHGEAHLHEDGPASAIDTENWDDVDGAPGWVRYGWIGSLIEFSRCRFAVQSQGTTGVYTLRGTAPRRRTSR